jgi:hypothetical protein
MLAVATLLQELKEETDEKIVLGETLEVYEQTADPANKFLFSSLQFYLNFRHSRANVQETPLSVLSSGRVRAMFRPLLTGP